ncbi:DUF4189 domain-containing protein [Pararoseomonas indoligenes]|uniref:DUF4189 domain-containing protein n=1 Tax=Roseomonas indoligenes TaxID=2820811 RepID=A0A940S772_9PROT|nr:DUF4189 domain-containing protein [Pararoseomonas indoligenes]MBP0494650.1 DUF4189 domain-containing protein [Pararoseomonas indoligenes]
MQGVLALLRNAPGLVLAMALGFLPHGASAQDSPFCRTECAAPFADRAQNTTVIQACLVRCAARSAALGRANISGTMAMPTPQTPWTQLPGSNRALTRVAQAQRPAETKPVQREAARGRRAPGGAPVTAVAAAPPAPSTSLFGSLMAAQAAEPGLVPVSAPATPARRTGRGSYGAVYLAAAPSRSFGLAVGVGDRAVAHRQAEAACKSGTGADCRMAGDFTARCAAVAHALRSNNAVVMTAHSSTYTVMAATSGTGATREEAERQALSACSQRGRGLTCTVTEARCAD